MFDEQGDIWRQYKISSQPAWIFIDTNGNQERVIGALNESEIRTKLENLLNKNECPEHRKIFSHDFLSGLALASWG